jgi:hypothetical protein
MMQFSHFDHVLPNDGCGTFTKGDGTRDSLEYPSAEGRTPERERGPEKPAAWRGIAMDKREEGLLRRNQCESHNQHYTAQKKMTQGARMPLAVMRVVRQQLVGYCRCINAQQQHAYQTNRS